ncbi:MAG: DNA polymerase IV [Syntrophaceae bacterium]
MKRILHIDMDAFFAAVEEKRRPWLKGKPVIIGGQGDPTKRGVVSTASYEARKYGVHSAMPLRTAHRLCPDGVYLPVDYPEYSRVSRCIKTILRNFSAVMEDVGIDEAFLDVSASGLASEEIAQGIKECIRAETGLTCSIGIAPNKLLAKIGSDYRKPDGLTIIEQNGIAQVLGPLPVRKLWGIGPKTEARLHEMNIMTVADLAAKALDFLQDCFGESYGHFLYNAARGIDDSELVTHWEPRSLSRETTFQHDISKWQDIARTLAALVKETVEDLQERGYVARTATVKIRFSGFETFTRSRSIPEAIDNEEALRRAAFDCLGRFDIGGPGRPGVRRRVRLVGFRLSNLERKNAEPSPGLLLPGGFEQDLD